MTDDFSPVYDRALDLTREHHRKSKTFSGRFVERYLDDIERIVADFQCETMLDYGCGKGIQYREPIRDGLPLDRYLGVTATLYDPGWPEYALEPTGKFDLTICTQALGAIPVTDSPAVIAKMIRLTRKVVFIGERLTPVKKRIHDEMAAMMPRDWTHAQWVALVQKGVDIAASRGDACEVVLRTRRAPGPVPTEIHRWKAG